MSFEEPTRSVATDLGPRSTANQVFFVFLRLGLTSFGGPIAHLGYFREEFVQRRRWLDDAHFAQILAVSQFLPGPASSQTAFALGLLRAGWRGALAGSIGFTLPSALLMFAFAWLAPPIDSGVGAAVVHGLKLVAVVVVAHGLMRMARQHAWGISRALIAASAAVLILSTGAAWAQLLAIALGAVAGAIGIRSAAEPARAQFRIGYGRRVGVVLLAVFAAALTTALLVPAGGTPNLPKLASAFYRAGALVFGGGHVVLPLLQQSIVEPGWVPSATFLAGYGAAQAMPGPMFSFAAYLGGVVPTSAPSFAGALVATIAIFLPGLLLLAGVLPFWTRLVAHPAAARVIAGINASVLGLLAAAFYSPVLTQGIRSPADIAIAVIGLVLLAVMRTGALWVVVWCVLATLLASAPGVGL